MPGEAIPFTFEGRPVEARAGESIAAALLAAGVRHLRTTRRDGRPRGVLCGIGHCYDCLVTLNGVPSVRACLAPVRAGDVVEVQDVADPR
jgi:predicted molibdopterin-dependent oxidoreductase YjgC